MGGSGPVGRRTVLRGVGAYGLAAYGLGAATVGLGRPQRAAAQGTIRFGLTPVFLNNDLELLDRLRDMLARHTGLAVELIQRRTYEEITALLLSGQLTAAWICGYPYVAYRELMAVVAVPVWRGNPLYQSYIIVDSGRDVDSLAELAGDTHAFSDPNSNSGYLVTCAALAELRLRPEAFFRKSFFTYGHRNVVRAVASGLAQSGSVDGYVWEVIAELEPELARRTRPAFRSDWLGFPPICCPARLSDAPETLALTRALMAMGEDPVGADVLRQLRLDRFTVAEPQLFDGIANLLAQVRRFG